MRITKILLADDHQIVRKGLRAILERESDFSVVAEATSGTDAVEQAAKLAPDVVLMDISMPGLNGIDACRKVVERNPEVRVIALTVHSIQDMISGIFRAGAVGYLLKDAAVEELVHAVRTVTGGGVYVSPRVAGAVIDGMIGQSAGAQDAAGAFVRLTNREREVLQLMSEGYATKEVARLLNVSVKTAETHRRAIMEKLDMHSVAELTKYAIREGLTTV
ncbi:MAG TPA: response regulator transcription factor [Humisphaera sp.]